MMLNNQHHVRLSIWVHREMGKCTLYALSSFHYFDSSQTETLTNMYAGTRKVGALSWIIGFEQKKKIIKMRFARFLCVYRSWWQIGWICVWKETIFEPVTFYE